MSTCHALPDFELLCSENAKLISRLPKRWKSMRHGLVLAIIIVDNGIFRDGRSVHGHLASLKSAPLRSMPCPRCLSIQISQQDIVLQLFSVVTNDFFRRSPETHERNRWAKLGVLGFGTARYTGNAPLPSCSYYSSTAVHDMP